MKTNIVFVLFWLSVVREEMRCRVLKEYLIINILISDIK